MQTNKNNEVKNLIIPEDDLISFHTPSYDAVRGAYSPSFKAKPVKQSLIKKIEKLFPKNSNNKRDKESEDPGFSIDDDADPLII
ncbi:MAG: hypothetical protein QM504_18970 [Pseudomonadota bacterium]